jgi:polyisoprenoid-binding protein YceI
MAHRTAALTAALVIVLAGGLPAQQPRELRVDAAGSRIYVVTHRTGLLSFLGHEHAILAPRWTAQLCWDAPLHAGSRAELIVDARALEIDRDSVRVLAGLGSGPSPQQRMQIERKLHDAAHLGTEQYPELTFRSRSVRAAGDTLFVRGALTIRDRTRDVELPVLVQRGSASDVLLTGVLQLRQRDFGIRPESIAGVVKVADPVDLHVVLRARATGNGCTEASASSRI